MKLVDMVCPNCGAKIQADADMGSAKCEHCGSTFILDDEAVHVKYDNAYEAGYQFEKEDSRRRQKQDRGKMSTGQMPEIRLHRK